MNTPHPIHLEKYNSNWPVLFADEKQKISQVLGDKIIAIEHIGSTAIPGIKAKPIIDIMAGTSSEQERDACAPLMITLGYDFIEKTNITIPERKTFKRYTGVNTGYNVHIVIYNGNFWKNHLLFRNYLRTHPEERTQYEQVKQELAQKFPNNRATYGIGKTKLIEEILAKAQSQTK